MEAKGAKRPRLGGVGEADTRLGQAQASRQP